MANGNDLRATLSVSIDQKAAEKELAQALKKLEKHPGMKALTINIKLDNKLVQALNQLKQIDTGLQAISVQASVAVSDMNALGEAARAAAVSASLEWLKLGETLQQLQSLTVNANAKATEAVAGANVGEQVVENLRQTIEVMAALSTIALFKTDVLEKMGPAVASLISMYSTLRLTMGTVAASVRVAASAFLMLGKVLWPVALISGIVWGLSELYKAFSGTNEKTKEAEKINFDHINSLQKQRDELRQLAGEYDTLKAAQEAGYATIEQKQRLLSLQTQLVESYGVSASAISAEGDAFATNGALIRMRIDALNEEIAAQHELDKLKLKLKDSERTETIQNTEKSIIDDKAEIEKLQHKAEKYKGMKEATTNSTDAYIYNNIYEKALEDIDELIQGIEIKRGNLKTALSGTTNILRTELEAQMLEIESGGARVTDSQRAFMEGILESIARDGNDLETQFTEVKSMYNMLRLSYFDSYLYEFQNAKNDGNVEAMKEAKKQVSEMLDMFNIEVPLTNTFRESILAMFDTTSKKATMSSDEVKKFTKDSIKELSSLKDTYQKLSRGEELSSDAVADLIAQHPELAKYLNETNDLTFQRGQLIKQVMEKQRAQRIEELEDSIKSTKSMRDELENKRKLYEDFYSKINGVFSFFGVNLKLDEGRAQSPEDKKKAAELDEQLKAQEAALALMRQPMSESLGSSGTSGTSGSSSAPKEKYEPSLNFSKSKQEVDDYNRLLEQNNDEIQLAIAQGGLYDKRLAKRISLYSDLAKSLNNLSKEQEKERDSLRTKLTKTGLVDSAGEVVADVEKRLLTLSKGKAASRLGHTAEELEQFVERYLELAGEIADTASQLRAATNDLADTLQIGLDKITAASTRKQDKAQHKIAMLGEINTEDEKKLLAQYSAEIIKALSQEQGQIDAEIAKANAAILNKNSSKQEKEANRVHLENLKQEKKQVDENLIQESEQYGKSQAEALSFGFNKTLEELKYAKSLLGNIDTDEERKKAAELDQQIHDTLTKGIDRYNQDIVELERKLSTELKDEERHRAQAKLEVLREYVKNYTVEQAQAVSAWENSVKSSAKDAMSALEDFYAKQGKAAQKLLDDQLEDYRSFIEERKKLFKRENEEEDFNGNRSKLQKEEAELKKQLAVLSLDNSIEGQYKREQLEQELADKAEEIRKLELDRTRNLREQNYDDLLKKKEDEIKVAKDAADTKWQQDLAADQHYSALKQAMLENNTAKMQETLLNFSNGVQIYMDAIGKSIDRNLVEKLEDTQRFQNLANTITGIPNLNGSTPPSTSPNGSASNGTEAPKNAKALDWKEYLENKEKAEKLKNFDPEWVRLNTRNNQLRTIWKFPDGSYAQLKDLKFYHEGGEVGVEGTTTAKWWQGVLRSDEVLSVLRKGEAVIKNPGAFVQQMISSVAQRMNAGSSFALSGTGASGPVTNHYEYDIRIERLEGGEAGAKALFKHIKTQSQRGNRI